MSNVSDLYQTSDWKKEKHVPVIEAPTACRKGEPIPVKVTLGKEVSHPNTTAHHIAWMRLYFQADGEKYPYELGHVTFAAHGASAAGPDESGVYTHHEAVVSFKTEKSGTLMASSYCNIHGLWQSEAKLTVA